MQKSFCGGGDAKNLHIKDSGLKVRPSDDVLRFPIFAKPEPVGFFSINTERLYEGNAKNLSYYKPPNKFPLDLNIGIQNRISKDEDALNERLDNMLTFIWNNKRKLLLPITPETIAMPRIGSEFVCFRGLLRLLMCTPYERNEDWCILVTRYEGSIYLIKKETEAEKQKKANETEQMKIFGAYGYKFEQYCLSDSPFIEPDTSKPVDECSEFNVVFHAKLEGLSLLYGAEMDGVLSEQPILL